MPATIKTGKAKRKELAFFYKTEETLEIIGKGIEEASISPSAEIESVTDILGNTETTLSSYEKTTDLDPIYLEGGNKFSEWLDTLEETDAILDDAVGTFVVVKLYKTTEETKYVAWEQQAVVELTGFGGDTKGVNLPCTLHWIGERTMGTFNPSTKQFTADDAGE
ncbi:MAG TPA: hypothetical protein H9691_05660 [Firmicutes bacterium]|nr:hypothetical protein [Bacillota bacterium]